jgi:Ser/Thr protein kinase RdoA (MazF antagonist)
MNSAFQTVLHEYGLDADQFRVEKIGKGHIHDTYKLTGQNSYVLQRFNHAVFTRPAIVERNIRLTSKFLAAEAPNYRFVSPVPTRDGRDLVYDAQGQPWRLYPFVANSYSVDEATSIDQAFRAAAAFGRLGRLLDKCDPSPFQASIDGFHDLSLRFRQFNEELSVASAERRAAAAGIIPEAINSGALVTRYNSLITGGTLRQRVFHNDTKVNNVLFDKDTHEALAVVDLDTLMPGYFIYDLGDLVRTVVSPVGEEEKVTEKVAFRRDFYDAVVEGYLSEMAGTLSDNEREVIGFSGQMMTCIMALRFLADFLRGDTYYHTTYPGQNLVRARNQFRLLELLKEAT